MFRPNPSFLNELREQGEIKAPLREQAEAVKAKAEPMTPRIMRRNPQAYEVQTDPFTGDVLLVNTDHGGHLAEWGSANNPAQAPLRRAVRAQRLRFEESPKT